MKTVKLTKPQVSTAIFEYLQNRGKRPNRKRGVVVKQYNALYDTTQEITGTEFFVKVK